MYKKGNLFLILLFFFNDGFAQVPYFQNYYLQRKNEPVNVNAIFQDRSGYIWYGTNKGLFQFDGTKQKLIRTSGDFSIEKVTAVAQDSAGKIWVGDNEGGLSYVEKDVLKKFNPKEGTAAAEISDIIFDNKGNLWFSTKGDGLYYYTQDRLFRLDENEKMPDLYIYDIVEDKQGNIWAGTDGGFAICTLQGRKVSINVHNYESGLPDNIVKKIKVGHNGTMWLGTEEAGIVNYNPLTNQYVSLFKDNWMFGSVTDFLVNRNQLWISCSQSGLIVYDQLIGEVKLYDKEIGQRNSTVNVLLQDAEGSIWGGTNSGVIRTPGNYIEYIAESVPAQNMNVLAITIDKDGCTWFSNSDGLFKREVDKKGVVYTQKQLINNG